MLKTERQTELKELLKLSLPLCATHVGLQLMSFVDTAVVGRLGAVPLAGVGLANGIFFTVIILAMGTMMGLDPLISQALGAKNPARARQLFWQGVYLAGVITVIIAGPIVLLPLALVPLGIDPEVAQVTRTYLLIRVLGVFPGLLYVGARSYLQALGVTRPLVISTIVANIVNLIADIVLVFGGEVLPAWMGPLRAIPALGPAGAAWATVASVIVQYVILAFGISRSAGAEGSRALDAKALYEAVRVGLPVGLQLGAETGVFALAGFLAGRMGAHALAAHQIAITLASMTFMVAVGLGSAGSVRVGRAIGARDTAGTRSAGLMAFFAGGTWMTLTAILFVVMPREVALLITDKEDLIAAVIPLLMVAAAFQISDGLQAVGSGVLRGAGDTRFAFYANVAGHWLVGLPIALLCGVKLGMGVVGLWIGLAAGLSAVAVALFVRFLRLSSKPIAPLENRGSAAHP